MNHSPKNNLPKYYHLRSFTEKNSTIIPKKSPLSSYNSSVNLNKNGTNLSMSHSWISALITMSIVFIIFIIFALVIKRTDGPLCSKKKNISQQDKDIAKNGKKKKNAENRLGK